MSTKKKLSLKEFMQDEALGGGSWADDDFDPSSISVPISNQRHMHDQLHYQSNSHSVFGGRPSFQNGPQSPPFIIKLSNIPRSFGIAEIQDLFQSRFTRFVKMKLFWDIDFNVLNSAANPLDALNKRKKVSFVEVETYRDFEKVLKWNDLYLDRGMGKILVNNGNFDDFRIYNDLNQQVPEIDDPSVSSRPERRLSRPSPEAFQHPRLHRLQDQLPPPSLSPTNQANQNRPLHPLDRLAQRQSQGNFPAHQVNRNITAHPITPHQPLELSPLRQPEAAPISLNKPNPFGSAKPVDTLSKQLELEKTLRALEINKTTYKTLGQLEEEEKEKREAEKKKEEFREKETESAKEEVKKPESRQSPSLASLHLKKTQQQQHQNSSKTQKIELVVAPPPSVSAWASSNSNNLSNGTNIRMVSPQAKSPNCEPSKLSASVFQGKKKNTTKEDETRRKVILKKKNLEHKKPKIKKGAKEETPVTEELEGENNVEKTSELKNKVKEEQISDSTIKPESANSQKAKFESNPQKEKAEKRQNSNNKERKPKEPKSRSKDVKVIGNVSEVLEDQSTTPEEELFAREGVIEDIKAEILTDSSRGRGGGPSGRGRDRGRNGRGGRGGFSEKSSRESSGDGALTDDDFKSVSKREVEHDVNTDKYNGTNGAKDIKEVKPSRESRHPKFKGKKEAKQADESNDNIPQNDTKEQKEQKLAKEQKVASNSQESSNTRELKETSPLNAEGSPDGPPSTSEPRRGRGRGGFRGRGRGRASFKNISKSYNKKAPEADS